MRSPLTAAWRWITDDTVIGTTSPDVGRVFMRCNDCGRLRPAYQIVMKAGTFTRIGCPCGSRYHRPFNPPLWQAVWWVVVVGLVWRKTLRRLTLWDPRMPMRTS